MNFQDIQNTITNLLQLLSNITNALLNNELFQITIGIVLFSIVLSIVFTLLKKLKEGYNQMDNSIGNNFSKNRRYYVTKAYINSLFR